MNKQSVLIIMSAFLYSYFSYLTYKYHLPCAVLYCHLWPDRVYNFFSYIIS